MFTPRRDALAGMSDAPTAAGRPHRLIAASVALVASVAVGSTLLAGCGSGGGTSPIVNSRIATPTPSPIVATPTPLPSSPTTSAVKRTITPAGGAITVDASTVGGIGVYTFTFLPNTVSVDVPVTIVPVSQSSLAVPLRSARLGKGPGGSTIQTRFTPSPLNKYLFAFTIDGGANFTGFNSPIPIAAIGVSGLPAGTSVNLAKLQGGTYVDVATFSVDASGKLTEQSASVSLQGLLQGGTYLVYVPAAGTSTAFANYGIALVADDGNGNAVGGGNLQVINLYGADGKPLAVPTVSQLLFSGAGDLDGQALTPDGSQGILVDGGNTVRFFSGTQTGTPVASTTTVDISAYGGDGDSVAIMPNGETAVVSGGSNSLLVISGITSGNPVATESLPLPFSCDGVVISGDGKTMLARGGSGLVSFSIAPVTPGAGALGGTRSYSFTQISEVPGLGASGVRDGREGMAFSPVDSSRAVLIGASGSGNIDLVTGIPLNTASRSIHLNLPASTGRSVRHQTSRHGRALLLPTGASRVESVSVTPDGKYAVVGTDAGLILLSGIDTGVLTQVGGVYSPSFTVAGTTGAQTFTLTDVSTLGITLDGKYVVALTPQPSSNNGTILLIPITATGFGAPVSQASGIAVPNNDQLLIH